MAHNFFRGCTDLEGLVRGRLDEDASGTRPLPPQLRDRCHEWLAGEHREVCHIEERNLDSEVARAGPLTWRDLDETHLQQRAVVWLSRNVLLARAANLPSASHNSVYRPDLEAFGLRFLFCKLRNFDAPLFISALKENHGLDSLCVDAALIEPVWFDLFRSIRRHPTLLRLYFVSIEEPQPVFTGDRVGHTRAIVEMLDGNPMLQEFEAVTGQVDEQIMENEVKPRLRANVFRARIKALKEEGTDQEFQRRLIGASLVQVRQDPTAMFMMVSTFHLFAMEQYGQTQERLVAAPVSSRTRSRKRRRE